MCTYTGDYLLAHCPSLKSWTCSWAAHKAGYLTVEPTGSVVNSKHRQNQPSGALQASSSTEMLLRIPAQKSRCIPEIKMHQAVQLNKHGQQDAGLWLLLCFMYLLWDYSSKYTSVPFECQENTSNHPCSWGILVSKMLKIEWGPLEFDRKHVRQQGCVSVVPVIEMHN